MGRTQEEKDGAEGEGTKMSEWREDEATRREEAQAHAGEIVEGSGKRGKPRRMPRMVSARLEAGLVAELRAVALQRKTTVSDLLREGAERIVRDAYEDAVTVKVTRTVGTGWTVRRGEQDKYVVSSSGKPSQKTSTTRHAQQQPTTA